jgi:hypothetical protein
MASAKCQSVLVLSGDDGTRLQMRFFSGRVLEVLAMM